MSEFAWSQDADADVVGIVETIVGASALAGTCVVFPGRATKGTPPPFVNCWPLAPQVDGAGLAGECWGRAHAQWQLSPHGIDQAQARYLVEQITEHAWPDGWELVEIGPPVYDTTDEPASMFWPVTLVYRGMT